MEDLFNPGDENNWIEKMGDKALVAQMLENDNDPDQIESAVAECDFTHSIFSFKM